MNADEFFTGSSCFEVSQLSLLLEQADASHDPVSISANLVTEGNDNLVISHVQDTIFNFANLHHS